MKFKTSKRFNCLGILLIAFLTFTLLLQSISCSDIKSLDSIPLETIYYVGGNGPGNYSRIQDAIDNASQGDTVYVYNGTYFEHLIVAKSLFLKGQNVNSTFINGGNTGDVPCIKITADDVIVEGFSINWADWEYHEPGIEIFSDRAIIKGNNISIHDKGIILFLSAHNCTIIDNVFSNIHEGIYFWPPGSHNHIIKDNLFKNNNYGIKLFSSTNNLIQNNTFSEHNWCALLIQDSRQNTIIHNTIINNPEGVILEEGSYDNSIYHNNFIENQYQAIDTGLNRWDYGYPAGGNYWDDYNGNDANNDSVGDQPYDIPGGKNTDNYPLINRNQWRQNPLTVSFYGPEQGFVNQSLYFFANVSGGIPPYQFHWNFGDTHTANIQTPIYNYKSPGKYTVSLDVKDAANITVHKENNIQIYAEDISPPIISILSPQPGLYVNNQHVFGQKLPIAFIIGPITVSIQAEDAESIISTINLTIDDVISETINANNYSYIWSESNKGIFVIHAEAIDLAGNIATDEIIAIKLA